MCKDKIEVQASAPGGACPRCLWAALEGALICGKCSPNHSPNHARLLFIGRIIGPCEKSRNILGCRDRVGTVSGPRRKRVGNVTGADGRFLLNNLVTPLSKQVSNAHPWFKGSFWVGVFLSASAFFVARCYASSWRAIPVGGRYVGHVQV